MVLWRCEWADCSQPAVQRGGDCLLCDRHLCRSHIGDQWHKCPKPEDNWDAYSAEYVAAGARRMAALCARIDGARLCSRASRIRGGIPCTADHTPESLSSMMGGQNCHAEIAFRDGVTWLARFRLAQATSPPPSVRDYVLRSEVATMRFLHAQTAVPVPEVFDWAAESDPENDMGTGYILMEKVEGRPLDWQRLTAQQKEKVMQQLVDISLEIEKHPFDKLGSLMPPQRGSTAFEIQGIAHHSTFDMSEPGGRPLGPFDSSATTARSIVGYHLNMIANGEIGADYLDDITLAHQFRLGAIDSLWTPPPPPQQQQQQQQKSDQKEQFYLKHPDDKGDHILVDESFNIVSIIDWEWAQTVSRAEAFASPCMMWPVARFYEGSNELSEDEVRLAGIFRERGRQDLAECVLRGRKVQRFFFALGPSSTAHGGRETFADLFAGLRRAFGEQ